MEWWQWALIIVGGLWWAFGWYGLISVTYEEKGWAEPDHEIGAGWGLFIPQILFIGINGPVFYLAAMLAPTKELDILTGGSKLLRAGWFDEDGKWHDSETIVRIVKD